MSFVYVVEDGSRFGITFLQVGDNLYPASNACSGWQNYGISSSKEYAALTSILTIAWSGKFVQAYKKLKGLRKFAG